MATIKGDSGSSFPLAPNAPAGVWGESDNGYGVAGTSGTSSGLQGGSIKGIGAVGTSDYSTGVVGISKNETGVYGRSEKSDVPAGSVGAGVHGQNDQIGGIGVRGVAPGRLGIGVVGEASTTGVMGLSQNTWGVYGHSEVARRRVRNLPQHRNRRSLRQSRWFRLWRRRLRGIWHGQYWRLWQINWRCGRRG